MKKMRAITIEQIHEAIISIAEKLEAQRNVIVTEYPEDEEGFPQIKDQDLRDAIMAIDKASWDLSKLAFHIANAEDIT